MDNLLEIKNLIVEYNSLKKQKDDLVVAVNDVSLSIKEGEIYALAGESGCGKSMTAMSIMRLLPKTAQIKSGEIYFKGENLLLYKEKQMRELRGNRIALIPQDPMTSLNPLYTVGNQLVEAIRAHSHVSERQALRKAREVMDMVCIPDVDRKLKFYPHEFSGGMKQRIIIAMALACQAELIIADEPTTALDVTIQAQILDLLREIQMKLGTATILVSHDLGVVARVADRVAVMYAGKIVEIGTAEEVYYDPRHPYTWGLMRSLPAFANGKESLYTIPGMPPTLIDPPKGDAFACRNEYALNIDYEEMPPMFKITDTHYAATWLLDPRAPQIKSPMGGTAHE